MSRLLAVVIAVGVLATGLLVYSQWRTEPLHVSGFVEADEIRVGSRVGGRVVQVYVTEGQRVAPGEILVRLDPFDLEQQLAEADATLAARRAEFARLFEGYREEEKEQARAQRDQLKVTLAKLREGPRQQEKDAARARLDAAQTMFKLEDANLGRATDLYKRNVITREEFDQIVARQQSASANVVVRTKELALLVEGTREEEIEEARHQLRAAEARAQLMEAGYHKKEVEASRVAVAAAEAARDAIATRIRELVIRAPLDGEASSSDAAGDAIPQASTRNGAVNDDKPFLVEAVDLQPGDLVPPDAPVLSLTDARRLWVRAYVPENRLDLKENDPVKVTVDSFPDESFVAHVTFIASQAEFTPGNVQTPEERSKQVFRIKATLEAGLDRLRPGMSADVWLEPGAAP